MYTCILHRRSRRRRRWQNADLLLINPVVMLIFMIFLDFASCSYHVLLFLLFLFFFHTFVVIFAGAGGSVACHAAFIISVACSSKSILWHFP